MPALFTPESLFLVCALVPFRDLSLLSPSAKQDLGRQIPVLLHVVSPLSQHYLMLVIGLRLWKVPRLVRGRRSPWTPTLCLSSGLDLWGPLGGCLVSASCSQYIRRLG